MVWNAAIQELAEFWHADQAFPAWACGSRMGFTPQQQNVNSPIDGSSLAKIGYASPDKINALVSEAQHCFMDWRQLPAPRRGELVRVMGEIARECKTYLARFIVLEAGKTMQEALGEVQELIDICDFAVGLSRQLTGLTIASERPQHRMMEQWHPLGVVGIITAFNFPMAVWAWNATLALVCGNTLVWKPSEKTPLCALACQQLLQEAVKTCGMDPFESLSSVIVGGADVGEALAAHPQVALVSATGSVAMGRSVAQTVAARLGRSLLELGGNNGIIVSKKADLDLALKGVTFSFVGTSGQRCTSLRRLFLHESIANYFETKLIAALKTLRIGDPRDEQVLCGPLIDKGSFTRFQQAIKAAEAQGGHLLYGGDRLKADVPGGGYYVNPAVIAIAPDAEILQQETFAPLLYVVRFLDLRQALDWHNNVPQGLSSAIFTNDLREAEQFLAVTGSDCGIANVNIGTSGAEIGGAFGGEKDTGGGRESGSDAWKNYMRRSTNTINYGTDIPLAQGIRFEL